MQFSKLMGLATHAQEHGRRDWDECFYFVERYFKRLNLTADSFEILTGFLFGSSQAARRQHR